MGRKHFSERTPQHTRHAKQRRRWRSGDEPVPRGIGVRRPLQHESALRLIAGLRLLQVNGELPEELDFRPKAFVDIVPLRLTGRQAQEGIVRHYDVREIGRRLVQGCDSSATPVVPCDIKNVSMKTGGHLRITLASDTLESERQAAASAFEQAGFKGIHRYREQTALHVNLATCQRDALAYEARQELQLATLEELDAVNRLEEPLLFGAWDIYPNPERLAA